MKYLLGVLITGAALVLTVGSDAGEKKEPKYEIKEVMRKAHKGGLMKKVASGNASAEEKKELVEFYVALSQNKPPMNDDEDWKERTTKLVAAAKAAAGDDAKAAAKAAKALPKLANCGECHSRHK